MSTFQGNSQFPFQGNAPSVGKMKTFGLLSMSAIAPIGVNATPSSFLGAYNGATVSDSTKVDASHQHDNPSNDEKIAELVRELEKAQQTVSQILRKISQLQPQSWSDTELIEDNQISGDLLTKVVLQFQANNGELTGELKTTKKEAEKDKEKLQEQINRARQHVVQLQGQLGQEKQEYAELLQRFRELRRELDLKTTEAQRAFQEVGQFKGQMDPAQLKANHEIGVLQSALNAAKECEQSPKQKTDDASVGKERLRGRAKTAQWAAERRWEWAKTAYDLAKDAFVGQTETGQHQVQSDAKSSASTMQEIRQQVDTYVDRLWQAYCQAEEERNRSYEDCMSSRSQLREERNKFQTEKSHLRMQNDCLLESLKSSDHQQWQRNAPCHGDGQFRPSSAAVLDEFWEHHKFSYFNHFKFERSSART